MRIHISVSSGFGKTEDQKVSELNSLISNVADSALYPNVEMSEFFLALTKFLYAPNKPSALDDAIFAAQNAEDGNSSERRRYPADRTAEQEMSYKVFSKLKSELKKVKPITVKEAKKHLAVFDRLAELNNAAQSLMIHKFDPNQTSGHHKALRDTLEREGIFISISAKAEVNIANVNKAVKAYFKKAKHFDVQQRSILFSCKSLAAHFVGRPGADFRKSFEIMADIIEATKVKTFDTTDHYNQIDPALLRIGLAAFKKMKELISETDVTGSNVDKLDMIYRLSTVCGRILDTADPATSVEDFKKFKTLTQTLDQVGIKY